MIEYWPKAKVREHDKIRTQYTYNPVYTIQKALECIESWDSFYHYDIVKAYIVVEDEDGDKRTFTLKRKWTIDEEKEVIEGDSDQGL